MSGKRKRFNNFKKPGDNRPSWNKNQKDEPHAGSIPLETIRASEAYERRVTQPSHSVKRKYAVCFSYLGSNYQGLQINPDAKTIEAELERALLLAGGIIEQNFGFMNKVQWTRAARTDRGVHALTQCCAMKLVLPEKERTQFIDEVNSFLPPEIRVQHLTKVSKSFNAKALCTKRRYHYLLPTFVLQDIDVVNQLLAEVYQRQGPVKGAGYESGYIDPNTSKSLTRESLEDIRAQFTSYRATAEVLDRLRAALKSYEGTKNFHNFTSGKEAGEANAKRFIVSFTCEEPFVCSETGVEYVLLSVLGQSFLLNQIRKMVHFAVEICRGGATAQQLADAFSENKVEIPMAPAVGLFLDELFFDGFNIKQRFQSQNDKRIALKKQNEAEEAAGAVEGAEGAVSDEPPSAAAEPAEAVEALSEDGENEKDAKRTKIDDDEGDDDETSREQIDWYSIPEVKEKIDHFRMSMLYPHIFAEEAKSLIYLYYLDYCRAFPHHYKPYNLNKESKEKESDC